MIRANLAAMAQTMTPCFFPLSRIFRTQSPKFPFHFSAYMRTSCAHCTRLERRLLGPHLVMWLSVLLPQCYSAWYKPEGGRKLPAVLEAPEVDANMNQQSYCRLRSNAGNRHDALCIGIRCSHLFQPPLGFLLLLKKIEPNFTPALKRSHHVLRNKLGMLFKMCHHAGLNELRRFSDGTSELFESCVDLIAYLNAQLLKALILVLQNCRDCCC